mgnify:FL=1
MEKVRKCLEKMSLKKTLVLLFVISLASVMILAIITIWIASDVRQDILDKRPIIVLDYSEHRVENDQDISGPEGFRVTVNDFQYGSLEWKDQAAYWTAGVLMAALPTVYAAAAAVITARIYYRIKLRTPFQLLKTGMEHISDQNLDFQLRCTQEDEAGMLCRMFEEMRTEVYQSNSRMWEMLQERKLLTASVSHDLRTPITVVKGYLEYLQKAEKSEKLSEEVLIRIISEMQQAVARMERYIDCVRDIQNLDDIEIRKEPCRMIDLKADIERSFSLIAEKRGRKFQIQDHFRREILYTDRDMLMRILENIFDNAVRYSKNSVILRIEENTENMSFTVKDDGNGFSEESLQKAEGYFYSSDKENGHYGIGLSVSRVLCEKLNGTISIYNDKNGGACVRLRLKNSEYSH